MPRNSGLAAFALLMALAFPPAASRAEVAPPAGTYRLDPAHARIIVDVDHLSFSRYLLLFRKLDATLEFDPANPAAMAVTATLDLTSVETFYPDPAYDFNAGLRAPEFLDTAANPEARFVSTGVTLTGERTADVAGNLTLRGITRPLTLQVRYNGGYAASEMDPGGSRIGFSMEGTLKRSDFGMTFGIPPVGTTMGVADEVRLRIEAEFLRPKE